MPAPHLCAAFASTLIALLLAGPAGAADAHGQGFVGDDGVMQLSIAGHEWCTLTIGLHDAGWAYAAATAVAGDADSNTRRFRIRGPGGAQIAGAASFSLDAASGISAAYTFAPDAAVTLNSLHVSADFAARDLAGGSWSADGKQGPLPLEFKEPGVFSGTVRALGVKGPDGRELALTFAVPTPVLIQDNRRWSPGFSLRIGAKTALAKGETATLGMQLSTPGGLTLGFDRPVTIAAGADWIPLALDLDIVPGSALDFSAMGLQDAPAGRLGRVVAHGAGFAYADDAQTPRRFYGVNLCFGAQYLPHADADRLADRFVRLGYNTVRIHHYEGELMGRRSGAEFVPEKLDQLDYLLAAFAKRGIYITTDLFVSRPVSWADLGSEAKGQVSMNGYKVLVAVDERAFADWQSFTRRFLDHRNPYTKLRYADDPALAWLSLVNEGNFENYYREILGMPQWQAAFDRWLLKRYADRAGLAAAWGELAAGDDPASGTVGLPKDLGGASARTRDALLFLAATERDMVARMIGFIRKELGCQALITNNNAWTNRVIGQLTRTAYDYVDDHFYIDHPQFLDRDWQLPSRCPNANPIRDGATGGRSCNFTRLWDKPFTVTEFNYSGPGRYRGVGGILTGAMGALQGWSGIWRFAYSHGAAEELKPARMDYFNLATDPLNQAADRATICLFLREDMQPAPHRVAVTALAAELEKPPTAIPHLNPGWNWLGWVTGVGFSVQAETAAPGFTAAFPLGWATPSPTTLAPYAMDRAKLIAELKAKGILAPGNPTDPDRNLFQAETGELLIDAPRGVLVFDTPKTAGGYADAGETITAPHAGVVVRDLDAGATVFVTALDGRPIASSSRLLVTHLTDLQNSGARFAESARRTLLDWGGLPHLMAKGSARVVIACKEAAGLKVWALSTSGKRLEEVPAKADAQGLSFTVDSAGPDGARLLYEIARP
jgi:hypothetical protein